MEIPKHIEVLSILFFLNAAIAVFIGGLTIISMINSSLVRRGNSSYLTKEFSNIGWDFSLNILITMIAIILLIVLGISLRKLKPWARNITLVYSMFSILFGLISLITGDQNISYSFFLQIYAVWVLFRPDVKEAFSVRIKKQKMIL
jgi:hypothetical protein